jgi:undecaprenyl-diphosphatase
MLQGRYFHPGRYHAKPWQVMNQHQQPIARRTTAIVRTAGFGALTLFGLTWLLVGNDLFPVPDLRLHAILLLGPATRGAFVQGFRILTALGGFAFLSAIGLLCVAALLFRRRPAHATLAFITIAGGRLLAFVVKTSIDRPRPPLADHLVAVHSASFPSEHAFNAVVTYGLLALLSGSRLAYLAAVAIAALIGLSRIVLGVHWPTDVIAGWSLGVAWLCLCWGLSRGRLRHRAAP